MLPFVRMDKIVYTNGYQARLSRVLPDLIGARQLLLDLVWKEIRARYRYATLGFAWAVLEPLLMMLVLTLVFSLVFRSRIESLGIEGGRGYAAFVLCGLVPWQFFSASVTTATRSLVDNRELVKKVYFPREVIPLSAIGVALVNFAIGTVLLFLMYWILTGTAPGSGVFWWPVVIVVQLGLVCGLSLFLASANAHYRDVAYMVEAVVLFGFYATPIIYPPEFLKEAYPTVSFVLSLNPMAGIVTAYRECLFLDTAPRMGLLVWPALCAAGFLGLGVAFFRRRTAVIADYL